MGLREAMTDLAQQMEEDIAESSKLPLEHQGPVALSLVQATLKGYLRQLRMALRASEGQTPVQQVTPFAAHPMSEVGADIQHILAIEEAKKQARTERLKSQAQEGLEGMQAQVECIGGEADGVFAPVNINEVTEGAKTTVMGQVYQYRGRKLHYDEEATRRLRGG